MKVCAGIEVLSILDLPCQKEGRNNRDSQKNIFNINFMFFYKFGKSRLNFRKQECFILLNGYNFCFEIFLKR